MSTVTERGFFLDRDGVINRPNVIDGKPYAPTSLEDFEFLPGVCDSLIRLRAAGFKIIVVTNQPDLSTGKQNLVGLNEIHSYVLECCPVDLIKFCGHTSDAGCACRKPHPGMLFDAAAERGINLAESFMIGDRWVDVEAGQRAGCKEVFFIDYNYREKRPTGVFTLVESLASCVNKIITDLH